MSIGQRLKEARRVKNLTQSELAEAVGVSNGAIGNYETDVSSPNEPILIRLMEVLQIDANFLYQDYIQCEEKLSSEEMRLIELFRGANDQARGDAFLTLEDHQKKDMLSKAE